MKLDIYLETTDGPIDEFMLAKMVYDLCERSFGDIDASTVANMIELQCKNKGAQIIENKHIE